MPPTTIKILPAAQPHIADIRAEGTAAEEGLHSMIAAAAAVDGDRCLDAFEAEAVRSAYNAVATAGAPLTADTAGEMRTVLDTRLEALRAARPTSTEVHFTSEGAALTKFRDAILGSMKTTIEKAAGRPVDINTMVFAFTDAKMADGILKLAAAHSNVTFRLLTDWSQLATSGGRQPRRLLRLAKERGLDNVQVRFKKDAPYAWNATRGEPVYNHGATTGLNHHKGFVALIDGRPEKMALGSFNWSVGAMKSNYENLMVLDRADSDNRRVMEGYEAEFTAFWNDPNVALTELEARRYKEATYESLYAANGAAYTPNTVTGNDDDTPYVSADLPSSLRRFDLNSFADADTARLEKLLGKGRAQKVQAELRDYGRFDGYLELLTRVPEVASAPRWALEQLRESIEYGDGGLSVNTATAGELDRAGFSRRAAESIVAFRATHGAFESLGELDAVRGIGRRTLDRVRPSLTADNNLGVYSGTVPGQPTRTGFSPTHHGELKVPRAGLDAPTGDLIPKNRADQEAVNRDLASVVTDMLRRAQPGQTMRLAMYGMSTSSPEYTELKAAIERGVAVRVVIYDSYNQQAIAALAELRNAGYDVDLRIVKARVMHEKFGVIGDDVFNGSSNWSSSSITKHAEDRFLFRNMPDLADRFVEEFGRLWNAGSVV